MRRWVRDRHRLFGPVLIICGVLLVPWLLYLSIKLPDTTRARNWSLMWTGVDVAEAVGLIVTGVMQWRRMWFRALPAAFTSALLAVDSWVDVTTSGPHAKALAITMAAAIEVPAAVACLILAIATFPVDRRLSAEGITNSGSEVPRARAAGTTGIEAVTGALAIDATAPALVPESPPPSRTSSPAHR